MGGLGAAGTVQAGGGVPFWLELPFLSSCPRGPGFMGDPARPRRFQAARRQPPIQGPWSPDFRGVLSDGGDSL